MANALAVLPVELDWDPQIESRVLSSLQAVTEILRSLILWFAGPFDGALSGASPGQLLDHGPERSDCVWKQQEAENGVSC